MTTAMETEEVDLRRKFTEEERDAMYYAYIKACEEDDEEGINKFLAVYPIHPRWAKIIAKVMGKEYLKENFNITHANEVFGEGWLDEVQEKIQ